MNDLLAKPIVKNKFWIVENHGEKIATIQAVDESGTVVYVSSTERKKYSSIKILSKEHNIIFDVSIKNNKKSVVENSIYGYPVEGRAYNAMWDVKHGFPVYTKINKSKSYFCAGYYLIKFTDVWVTAFCPKYIALNRYEHVGPFKTKEDMEAALNERN